MGGRTDGPAHEPRPPSANRRAFRTWFTCGVTVSPVNSTGTGSGTPAGPFNLRLHRLRHYAASLDLDRPGTRRRLVDVR